MKEINLDFIGLILLFVIVSSFRLNAQDCNSTSISDGEDYNTITPFQSFVAECDGELASISIGMQLAPTTFTLRVFEGGITEYGIFTDCSHLPSVQIYEEEFSGVDGYTEYVFTNVLPMLTMGQVYSFQIDDVPFIWTYYSGQYEQGILYGGFDEMDNCFCTIDQPCDFIIDHDLLFSVNVNRSAPVPTLGQWSMIVLLSLFLILGVVFIKSSVIYGFNSTNK
jgi:hypothetical protein